jgi:hypothetical protein
MAFVLDGCLVQDGHLPNFLFVCCEKIPQPEYDIWHRMLSEYAKKSKIQKGPAEKSNKEVWTRKKFLTYFLVVLSFLMAFYGFF